MHKQYYIEQKKVEKLISRRNQKADFYNGIYDRYEYPVLTREFAPVHWRYDLNEETNPYFMERLGINAVMNSGAIELDGKYYLVVRVEGNDRKSFFVPPCASFTMITRASTTMTAQPPIMNQCIGSLPFRL